MSSTVPAETPHDLDQILPRAHHLASQLQREYFPRSLQRCPTQLLPTTDVPGSKIFQTGMDGTAFPFKTGPDLTTFFGVNPYFKRYVRPFKTRSRVVSCRFSPFFPIFSLFCLSTPIQRRSTTLFFFVKGRFFPVKSVNRL